MKLFDPFKFHEIQPLWRVTWPGHSFEWDWTDWLGLAVLLLCLGFLTTAAVALYRKQNAMDVLRAFGELLKALFKARPDSPPRN